MHHAHRTAVRVLSVSVTAAALTLAAGAPASATVHEIVAQYCSGQPVLEPPGLEPREGKKNFAQPVMSNGFVGAPALVEGVGMVISLDFDHPASKVVGTGDYIRIGTLPDGTGLFLPAFVPDPDFPAFEHCPAMTR